jgi:hypothetical protein
LYVKVPQKHFSGNAVLTGNSTPYMAIMYGLCTYMAAITLYIMISIRYGKIAV